MRIIMICTGNICRSPMAEAFMHEELKKRGVEAEVSSAGIYAGDGSAASYEAVEVMREYGIDLAGHRSRALRPEHLQDALVLCMTGGHLRSVMQLAPDASAWTIGEYAGTGEDIADPYGCGIAIYRRCAAQIEKAVQAAADRIAR